MVTATLQTGIVVFWSLAEFTDLARLRTNWRGVGLGDAVPEPRANVSVLRDALTEVFAGSHHLVRPLASRTGFAVVREDRGPDENSYGALMTAKVHGNSNPVCSGDTARTDEVQSAYARHLGRITAQQLSASLVKVLYNLGGTRLRPSGAVYWLPGDRGTAWAAAVDGFERAAADGGRSVGYALRHELDAGSVAAVRDAVVQEVTAEAARIGRELLAGDLGDRAVMARKKEALALRRKVCEYERLLGVGLSHLKEVLDRVDQADATAALLLAADPFESVGQGVAGALHA
jgi:hypothetical protein